MLLQDPADSSGHDSGSNAPAPPTSSAPDRLRRQPMPRKGHTKSRRGCFNCKRRKVKCSEAHPVCSHCRRLGLVCRYPAPPLLAHDDDEVDSSPATPPPPLPAEAALLPLTTSLSASLQPTPVVFTMQDMRFFQHFLFQAYPPLPMQAAPIWQNNVASFAHQFDFLIHAMLAMGASHLMQLTGENLMQPALSHRVQAISKLNRALSHPCSSSADFDARLAALLSLGFQSSYMDEGMLDFLAMIRGCGIVMDNYCQGVASSHASSLSWLSSCVAAIQTSSQTPPVFRPVVPPQLEVDPATPVPSISQVVSFSYHIAPVDCVESSVVFSDVTEDIEGGDPTPHSLVDAALTSLEAIEPFCRHNLERDIFATTRRALVLAKTVSLVEGVVEVCQFYAHVIRADNDSFAKFVDPANYPPLMLLAHFFAVENMLIVASQGVPVLRKYFPFRGKFTSSWLQRIRRQLPSCYTSYVTWPVAYLELFAAQQASERSRG